MKKLNKKGVSLAELLAVVVIMGIIAAIAIPLVGNVIETSKKKAFIGDLITIKEAVNTYCMVEKQEDPTSLCKKSGYELYAANLDPKGVNNELKKTDSADKRKLETEIINLSKYISKDFKKMIGDTNDAVDTANYTGKILITVGANGAVTIQTAKGNAGGYTVAAKDPTLMKPEDLS